MDCLNFKKQKNKFIFDSKDYEKYKKHGTSIIHWLPVQKDLVKVGVLMPNKEIKKGLAEPMVKNLKVNDIIQYTRFGFCKLDKKKKISYCFGIRMIEICDLLLILFNSC